MKKAGILFSLLLIIFIGIWVFKAKTPAVRPSADTSNTTNGNWWVDEENLPKADDAWILDPEIPENYIPVPGAEELYMVIDEDGKIIKYRQRELQEDGSWLWKTINPDIPDNYESVEGLKDVYKVVDSNGKVSYFKYIRNDDDTFAFIPVDEHGNPLENKTPDGSEIPDNYKRITGNIYAVYNENNVIIGYKERYVDENGNYVWRDCEKPEMPDDGDTNSDNSASSDNSTDNSDNSSSDNTSNKDEHDGDTSHGGNTEPSDPGVSQPDVSNPGTSEQPGPKPENPGTRTETETIITYEVSGGWRITYRTIVTRVYDSNGDLVSTKKDGPVEIERNPITDGDLVPDPSLIKNTMSAEFARVKVGLLYNDELSKDILAEINAERVSQNIGPLGMENNSDAHLLSQIRAADMAIYGHTDYDSPLYGSIEEMCERYQISLPHGAAEIVWKTGSDRSASAIASRIKIMASESLNNPDFTSIGISIVSKGGFYYVNVVLL